MTDIIVRVENHHCVDVIAAQHPGDRNFHDDWATIQHEMENEQDLSLGQPYALLYQMGWIIRFLETTPTAFLTVSHPSLQSPASQV